LHAAGKESDIRRALAYCGYQGYHSLHTCPRVQHTRRYLSYIENIMTPFPGIVYTPEGIHSIPTMTPNLQSIVMVDGKQMKEQPSDGEAVSVGSEGLQGSAGGGGDKKAKAKDAQSHGGERGRASGNGDDEEDGSKGSEGTGGGGGGDGGGGRSGDGTEDITDYSPQLISIPFSSTLAIRSNADPTHLPIRFTTTTCADIAINENRKATSPPANSKWPGPWFGVDMTKLHIFTRNAFTNLAPFTLGLAQIRIASSSHPTSIIKLSPEITHTDEDISKVKREQNTVKGGFLTVAMNPNLRLGWTRGITEGVEKTQRRWQIIPQELGAGDGPTGAEKYKAAQWQYIYNGNGGGQGFESVEGENPKPKPSVVFGYSKQVMPNNARSVPELEVTVVACWSLNCTSNSHFVLSLPFRRSKENGEVGKAFPAFLNILHHVSMVVDLGEVGPANSWTVNMDAVDEHTFKGLAEANGPIILQRLAQQVEGTSSDALSSDCEVVIRQAIQGRVAALTERERGGARLLLPPDSFHQPEAGGSSRTGFRTPPPSPRPSSQPSPQSSPGFAN